MRLIGYERVSTADQEESGAGLGAQHAAIADEAKHRGWEIVATLTDTYSAATQDRPGLDQAKVMLRCGDADGLIVSKLDRLTRSVADFADLLELAKKQGWVVIAIDFGLDMTTAQGELVANILVAVSQWERRIIGVRTKEALAQKKAEGVVLGRPRALDPYTRRAIRDLRTGGMTLRAIADRLNEERVPTAHGGDWHPETIRKITA